MKIYQNFVHIQQNNNKGILLLPCNILREKLLLNLQSIEFHILSQQKMKFVYKYIISIKNNQLLCSSNNYILFTETPLTNNKLQVLPWFYDKKFNFLAMRKLYLQTQLKNINFKIQINNTAYIIKNLSYIIFFAYYCIKQLKIRSNITIVVCGDRYCFKQKMSQATVELLNNTIYISARRRSIADICRSLAHELVHIKQKEQNKIKPEHFINMWNEIEDEANVLAGRLIKDFAWNIIGSFFYNI